MPIYILTFSIKNIGIGNITTDNEFIVGDLWKACSISDFAMSKHSTVSRKIIFILWWKIGKSLNLLFILWLEDFIERFYCYEIILYAYNCIRTSFEIYRIFCSPFLKQGLWTEYSNCIMFIETVGISCSETLFRWTE